MRGKFFRLDWVRNFSFLAKKSLKRIFSSIWTTFGKILFFQRRKKNCKGRTNGKFRFLDQNEIWSNFGRKSFCVEREIVQSRSELLWSLLDKTFFFVKFFFQSCSKLRRNNFATISGEWDANPLVLKTRHPTPRKIVAKSIFRNFEQLLGEKFFRQKFWNFDPLGNFFVKIFFPKLV